MPPRIPGGEDAQPNERRLNHKGATNVPTIRLTTPRRTGRGTFQSRQSHRGSGPTYANRTQHNPSHASNRSQLFRGHVNYPGQYAPAHPHPGSSRHPAVPYPYAINSATQNPSKHSSSFYDARQPKRPRLEAPSQSRLDQPTSSKHTKKQLPKSRIEIKLYLPLYCRTGVHGYHASRRAWLDREVQRIELERKLRVYNTQYLDREVLLYCSAEESQDLPARGDSLSKREEQVPRFDTPDVAQRLLDELSKEEDVPIDDCAPTTVTNFTHQNLTHPMQAHAHPVDLLPKPTIPTKSYRPPALQPSSSSDRLSSSRPLSKGSHIGRPSPLSTSDQVQPAAPRDSLLPPVHRLPVTRVPSSNTLAGSTIQNINPRLPSYAFRSGSLTIKSIALTAPPTTQATSRDASRVALHKSPAPSSSQPNTAELRETWIDDSDSDAPLASTVVSRNPTRSANLKHCKDDLSIASSSNSTRSLHSSWSLSPLRMQHSPVVNMETVRVPLDKHDKSRRILQLSKDSLIHATMHGFINRVDLSPLRQRSVARTPASPAREQVDDVCLLQAFDHTIAILGHGRDEEQISLVSLDHDRKHISCSLDRPWNRAKKGGVSAVCSMMQPLMFASGGYDHGVHLWTLKDDLSSASPLQLAIKHNSVVQSLVPIRDTSHKLVSASADNNVHIWDLSSERIVNTVKTSNSVFHAHPTSSPFCILLEVAHRELQYELRDYRLVPETPVQRFGYETPRMHGRFIKGDVQSNEFVCGGRDGCIRLWDTRSYNGPFTTMTCFPPTKVVQAAFDQSSGHILVGSANNDVARVRYIADQNYYYIT